ncbi:hypothetical protein AXG93_3343s1000 [Marchantia polymorpha subsp. ruderalis]|uniref:Uncharacterized protein n=1 Tax=Marchantia polymorpha subsp. ruderalis TaxID=1480154 RepID=A0A176WAF3_MARPO|nr:hypothetical protein AXG93_3343s1000 [Marchantia polymorpha subsp. ruderalis]
MKVPRERAAKILTMSSDTDEDPMALEEVAAKAVEDVAAAESGLLKIASPWTSIDTVILETGTSVALVPRLETLEACRTAYDAESLKVDELSAAAKEKEQEYQSSWR